MTGCENIFSRDTKCMRILWTWNFDEFALLRVGDERDFTVTDIMVIFFLFIIFYLRS